MSRGRPDPNMLSKDQYETLEF